MRLDTFTRLQLIRRWLLGSPAWAMPLCEIDLPRGIATATITIQHESQEGRDTARPSGMEFGMAAGYDRLESLLPTVTGERS